MQTHSSPAVLPSTHTDPQSFGTEMGTPFFQPCLAVNAPGDRYEQEADAVADRVVGKKKESALLSNRMPGVKPKDRSSIGRASKSGVAGTQRTALKSTGEQTAGVMTPAVPWGSVQRVSIHSAPTLAPPIVENVLVADQGRPLEAPVREDMETRMGADFSDVRIRTDARAAESAGAVQAKAYTSGHQIVFGSGQYQPHTVGGRHLLAHELTHTVQQGAAETTAQNQGRAVVPQVGGSPDVIQREKQTNTSAAPTEEVELRDGRIVFSYDWYMSHAKKNKASRVNVTAPEAWKVIVKTLRKNSHLTWVTDWQINNLLDDFNIIGSIAHYQGGNVNLYAYTVINLITDVFGLPKDRDFMYFHVGEGMELLVKSAEIDFDDEAGKSKLAKRMADELLAITGLELVAKNQALESDLLGLIENADVERGQSIAKLVVDRQLLDLNFGKEQWDAYRKKLKLGFSSAKRKAPPAPGWLSVLEQRVKELIVEERYSDHAPENLPDRFYTVWDRSRWLGMGELKMPGRKRKIRAGIRIQQKMTATQVLEKIRQRLGGKVVKQEQKKVHKEALQPQPVATPYQWAEVIRRALMKKAYKETRGWRKHKTLNVPDGLKLRVMAREHSTTEQVFLEIWVVGRLVQDKQDEVGWVIPEKRAIFPTPLVPEMKNDLESLYRRIKAFSMALRSASDQQQDLGAADDDFNGRIDESYPAYIIAKNMREDHRTVTNGQHDFFMALEYQARGYRDGIESVSEASRNTVTEWRLLTLDSETVRKTFSLPERQSTTSDQTTLQPTFSSGMDEDWIAERRKYQLALDMMVSSINNNVSKQRIEEIYGLPYYQRVKVSGQEYELVMPKREGDYILVAQTYFEYNDRRMTLPSVAAFVFRTIDGRKLARQEAHSRPTRKKVVEERLKHPDLSGEELRALQQEYAQLEQLETKEYSLYNNFADKEVQSATAISHYKELRKYYRRHGTDRLKIMSAINAYQEKNGPNAGEFLRGLWTRFMEDYGHSELKGVLNGLDHKIDQLTKQRKQVKNFTKRIGSYEEAFVDKDAVETPEVVFVSEVTGKPYRLLMLVGEASEQFLAENYVYAYAKSNGNAVYIVADVTTKDTDRFVGIGTTKAEAVQNAYEQFAEDNAYGEGYLHYRIPQGPEGAVRNSPGIKRQVLDFLENVAAVAGIVALAFGTVATGGLLGGLALGVGVFAGVAGGVTAYNNISERIENNRFTLDVEFALDLVGIIGAFAAGAGAITQLSRVSRLGSTAAALSKVSNFLRLPTVLAIHSIADLGANAVLMALKVKKDLDAIDQDEAGLTKAQKAALRRQIISNAVTSGAMMMMSTKAIGDDVMHLEQFIRDRSPIVDRALPKYEELNLKTGITDNAGEFAVPLRKKGGEPIVRSKEVEVAAEAPVGDGTGKLPEADPRPAKSSKRNPNLDVEIPTAKSQNDTIHELPPGSVMHPKDSSDVVAVEAMYEQAISSTSNREAGVYFNPDTGNYIVVQGDPAMVFVDGITGAKEGVGPQGHPQKWKADLKVGNSPGQWKLLAHYHPNAPGTGSVSNVNRFPSGAQGDFGVLMYESSLAGGKSSVSRIDYHVDSKRETTIFAYDPNADFPFVINYPPPHNKQRKILRFKKIEDYHTWMEANYRVSMGEVPAHLSGEGNSGVKADPAADTLTDIPTASVPTTPGPKTSLKQPSGTLARRIKRIDRKLRKAKVNSEDAQRVISRGRQKANPEAFFKSVEVLLKRNKAVHRKVLKGIYSSNQAEYRAADFLALRLAAGGTYAKRAAFLLKYFDLQQVGRGVDYVQKHYPGLPDGWVFRRLEKAARAHSEGTEIMVWDDLPAVGRSEMDEGHQVIERGKGAALMVQGAKGDVGEYELALETLKEKYKNLPEREIMRRVDRLFRHEFTRQKRPQAVRRALASFEKDGDLSRLLQSLPSEGAVEVTIVLPDGRIRRVDHLHTENGHPIFRENKNVAILAAPPGSNIRAQIDKDIALLLRYPDSIVEWRMTDTEETTPTLADIADQRFLDYVRNTAEAAGVADRFVLIGDDVKTTASRLRETKTDKP